MMITVPFFYFHTGKVGYNMLFGFLFAAVFLVVGLILLVAIPSYMDKKHASCTQPVSGRIVDMVKEYMEIHRTPNYAPVFEYVYNGVVYREKSVLNYSKKPTIGEERILMIDPNNPEKWFDPKGSKTAKLIFRIVGGALLGTAVFALVLGGLVLWFFG